MPEAVSITYSTGWESTSEFLAGPAMKSDSRSSLPRNALTLRHSLEMVAADGLSRFSASGGPTLVMVRHGNDVEIRQSHGTEAVVDFADLVSACVRFRRQFIDEVSARFPDLLLNELIERSFRDSGLREAGRDRFLRHSRAVKLRNELT